MSQVTIDWHEVVRIWMADADKGVLADLYNTCEELNGIRMLDRSALVSEAERPGKLIQSKQPW